MKTSLKEAKDIFSFKRIMIIGCPSSGKSYLSKELSTILSLPVLHLDKIYWKPNWVPISKEQFDEKLRQELKKESWIIDGDYFRTIETRIASCDFIIYLDYETQECLDSYYQRVKTKAIKEFITEGCEEKIDPEFIEFIQSYNNRRRNKNIQLINSSHKPYIIFTNRSEKKQFVKSLKKI